MANITVYTTGPSEACNRVQNVLEAKGLQYDLVMIETADELAELTQRSGRKSCPIVYAGNELVGGLRETIEAAESGRLNQAAEA